MKFYIKSSIQLNNGSYLLDRNGNLLAVKLHVPSTTYVSRGIERLSCTDGQFLYDQKLIDMDEFMSIALYNFWCFLQQDKNKKLSDSVTVSDCIEFNDYAELRYAPSVRSKFMLISGTVQDIVSRLSKYPDFKNLNNKWYDYLKNEYVKVSVFNNSVEFRISSEDGFDWNSTIIDSVILEDSNPAHRYTIVRESSKGYRAYFINATLSDILENDKVVLSSKLLNRKVVCGRVVYSTEGL